MITMQEIADLAGVHKSTVDKVLHHRPGVSDPVRRKIQRLLDEYDYRPNRAAQALQYRKKQLKIGIVLIAVDALPFLQSGILKGLKLYQEFNIKTEFVAVRAWQWEKMAESLRSMAERKFDGVILSPINAEVVREAVKELAEANIPFVTVNSDLEHVPKLCYVGQDGKMASCTAARLMAECIGGKGDIAVVTSAIAEENNSYYVKIREKYFIRHMQEHYPEIRIVECIESMENAEITRQKTAELLQRETELAGIYITCGGVADVGKTVQLAGKAGKIKIIGYETYPQIVELMQEGCVTITIDSDIEQQGRLSVQKLMDFLLDGIRQEKDVFTEVRIVVKELL